MITDDEASNAAWVVWQYFDQKKERKTELRSDKQKDLMIKLAKQKNVQLPDNVDKMTKGEASQWIDAHIKKA